MTTYGYTLFTEENGPVELVDAARRAEEAGFDFLAASDHFSPWIPEQKHSAYVWSVLGAVAAVTERVGLMTMVTCPIMRYHPVVVAQKAATLGLLSQGRFTLGLGAGENLNEHVVGGWPHVRERHEMFAEALEIIRSLLSGDRLHYGGDYFQVPDAVLWDRPEDGVPIGVAGSGADSRELAGLYADVMIAVEPKPELGRAFEAE